MAEDIKKLSKKKNKKRTIGVTDIGVSGTEFWNGLITSEEYNTDLKGRAGTVIYDKMRKSDTQVQSSLSAIELPILQATWEIDAVSKSSDDLEIADYVTELMFHRMDLSWNDFLRQVLLYLTYGFMIFEKTMKVEDGKIWFRNLAPRLPKTLYKWNVGKQDGKLRSIIQYAKKGKGFFDYITIPASRLVLFVNRQEGDNYEGISLLRSGYKNWYMKSQLEKLDTVRHDRWAVGIPEVKLPEGCDPSTDDYKIAKQIVQNLRSHEQGYVMTPFGYEIGILQAPAPGQVVSDIIGSIGYHNEELAKNVLTQFLTLGTTKAGARSLGGDFQNFFLLSLQAVTNYIIETIGKFCIKPMVDLNFDGIDKYPKLKVSKIETSNFSRVADAVVKLVGGSIMTPGFELENHLRQIGNLPIITEEEHNPLPSKTSTQDRIDGNLPQNKENKPEKPKNVEDKKQLSARLSSIKSNLTNKVSSLLEGQIDKYAKELTTDFRSARLKKKGLLSSVIKGELLEAYRRGYTDGKKITNTLQSVQGFTTEESVKAYLDSRSVLMTNTIIVNYENAVITILMNSKKTGCNYEEKLSKMMSSVKLTSRASISGMVSTYIDEAYHIGNTADIKEN